jgi:hypothetical protein
MKKLFLTTIFALLSFNAFSQEKINVNNLVGYWVPDQESTQLFFWKDINGKLQMQDICGSTGESAILIEFTVNENSVYIKETFVKNNWTTKSTFTFINKKTLKRVLKDNNNTTITYTKLK